MCVVSFHYLHLFFPLLLSFVEKSTLNTAVSQFCSGFTELHDTFLEKVYEVEAPASHRVGSSKRPRANHSEGEPSST